MSENALALVVRGTDWSETSRISTLFTREFGKIRALAKGGRRLNSKFEIAFDLLNVVQVVFLKKTGGLELLTEAQIVERFPHLRTNLPALYAGYYIAELLSEGTQDYDPHPELFDVALETLRNLGTRPITRLGSPDAFDSIISFELVWLRELGYSPRLDACAVCARGLSVPEAEPVRVEYSPEAGGLVCPDCLSQARDRRPLSAVARSILQGLAGPPDGAPKLPELVPLSAVREVRAALGQTVSYVLGRRPRLLGYVDG